MIIEYIFILVFIKMLLLDILVIVLLLFVLHNKSIPEKYNIFIYVLLTIFVVLFLFESLYNIFAYRASKTIQQLQESYVNLAPVGNRKRNMIVLVCMVVGSPGFLQLIPYNQNSKKSSYVFNFPFPVKIEKIVATPSNGTSYGGHVLFKYTIKDYVLNVEGRESDTEETQHFTTIRVYDDRNENVFRNDHLRTLRNSYSILSLDRLVNANRQFSILFEDVNQNCKGLPMATEAQRNEVITPEKVSKICYRKIDRNKKLFLYSIYLSTLE